MAALEIAARSPSFTVSAWPRALDGNRTSIAKDKTQTKFLLANFPFTIVFLLRDCRSRTPNPSAHVTWSFNGCQRTHQRGDASVSFNGESSSKSILRPAAMGTSRARATEAPRYRGYRESRRLSCNRTPALPEATDKIPRAKTRDRLSSLQFL